MESTAQHPIALRLTDVRKSSGAVRALKGVTLEVRAGEVHALLGENGAGKSTLRAVAAGSLTPDEGTVEIAGATLDTASPSAAQALGLGVVYQHPALAEHLTVVENMLLSMPRKRRPARGARSGEGAPPLRAGESDPLPRHRRRLHLPPHPRGGGDRRPADRPAR